MVAVVPSTVTSQLVPGRAGSAYSSNGAGATASALALATWKD